MKYVVSLITSKINSSISIENDGNLVGIKITDESEGAETMFFAPPDQMRVIATTILMACEESDRECGNV